MTKKEKMERLQWWKSCLGQLRDMILAEKSETGAPGALKRADGFARAAIQVESFRRLLNDHNPQAAEDFKEKEFVVSSKLMIASLALFVVEADRRIREMINLAEESANKLKKELEAEN